MKIETLSPIDSNECKLQATETKGKVEAVDPDLDRLEPLPLPDGLEISNEDQDDAVFVPIGDIVIPTVHFT